MLLLSSSFRRATFAAFAVALLTFLAAANAQEAESPTPQGVAIVELFTSQGCSSCPSADRLLTRIDDLAKEQSLPVYALSMHVDYWNRLGWTDPYSSREFSDRQRDYASAVGSRSVYTPQMIVNGVTEFVGSDGAKAQRALSDALNKPATATVSLTATAQPGNDVQIAYEVKGAKAGSEVVVCLVADAEPNNVPRGENAGRQLSHRGVVRAMRVVKLDSSGRGEVTLRLAANAEAANDRELEVVGFVQQRQTRQIDGAAQTKIARRVSLR